MQDDFGGVDEPRPMLLAPRDARFGRRCERTAPIKSVRRKLRPHNGAIDRQNEVVSKRALRLLGHPDDAASRSNESWLVCRQRPRALCCQCCTWLQGQHTPVAACYRYCRSIDAFASRGPLANAVHRPSPNWIRPTRSRLFRGTEAPGRTGRLGQGPSRCSARP